MYSEILDTKQGRGLNHSRNYYVVNVEWSLHLNALGCYIV